ncbi:MerR family transcriptional regulator [Mycolicibacterium sp. Dal123E01]|uniref:MerR family transcriptional regulator n=1 Tax=Mycolicibacterium sp. Dal123E01 TaxID=3457578 RepID=UPI00403E97D7
MTALQLSEDEPLYPVGVVADRIGVPTATLRSWNRRYSIGPADHVTGRHRLYSEAEVRMLHRMRQLVEQGVSARSAARDAASARHGDASTLLAAAFALDSAAMGHVIAHRLRDRGVVDTWNTLIRPAFAALSTLQHDGEDCIDVEHLLSRVTAGALQRVPLPPTWTDPAEARTILMACCEGEVHTLALDALAAALSQLGHTAVSLGASVPSSAVDAALHRLPSVDAVVLWAQRAETVDVEAVKALTASTATIMVGGLGWDGIPLDRGVLRLATLDAAIVRLTAATQH